VSAVMQEIVGDTKNNPTQKLTWRNLKALDNYNIESREPQVIFIRV